MPFRVVELFPNPEALAKLWRTVGSKCKVFGYVVRKLRSIACILRGGGGLSFVEMAQNEDFLLKTALKTAFWRDTNID